VISGRAFPRHLDYEDMPQFENGVGMAREFVTMFNRRRSRLRNIRSDLRVMMITGHSAHLFLKTEILPYFSDQLHLRLSFHPVVNRFWGETVTVSGLLTGQDVLREARMKADDYDVLVLPPNCLNSDDLFLDNLTLTQFKQTLGKPVLVGRYNLAETVREVFS